MRTASVRANAAVGVEIASGGWRDAPIVFFFFDSLLQVSFSSHEAFDKYRSISTVMIVLVVLIPLFDSAKCNVKKKKKKIEIICNNSSVHGTAPCYVPVHSRDWPSGAHVPPTIKKISWLLHEAKSSVVDFAHLYFSPVFFCLSKPKTSWGGHLKIWRTYKGFVPPF